jgi:glycosyltransferase involved in cell wall biosynthesis
MDRLRAAIELYDPTLQFVEQEAFVPHSMVVDELRAADLFIFASSCENLPITLLEAMAAGLPVLSSNRGPMPEILGSDALFFDPEDPATTVLTIEQIVRDQHQRNSNVGNARERAKQYTWAKSATETWQLLASIAAETEP